MEKQGEKMYEVRLNITTPDSSIQTERKTLTKEELDEYKDTISEMVDAIGEGKVSSYDLEDMYGNYVCIPKRILEKSIIRIQIDEVR